MRVLIVSQYFWPENFRINDLATELARHGHQITVLTGLPNYPNGQVFNDYQQNPEMFQAFGDVEIVRVPIIPRGSGGIRLMLNYMSFALMACIVGPWKLRRRDFDVIFVNQLSPVTVGLPGALIAKLKRATMAMWVLDLWPDSLSAIGVVRSPSLLDWVGKLVALIYRQCDLVLAQSKSFVPEIRKLAPPGLAIEYLPSWAEDVFQNSDVTHAPEIPRREGCFDVMFAGNVGEAQDFPCILDAAEILKEHAHIRWLIVGDGRMRPWVEQEVLRRGLSHRVLLLGRFPVERMPSFYQSADALLVTLQDKPIFGMTIPGKLQSYLAAGRPILAALNGEGADLVKTAGAGYVCSAGDSRGLADAVFKLSCLSDAERQLMGMNGREVSEREFERSVVLDRLEQMLCSINPNAC